jgi:hypothetical protein
MKEAPPVTKILQLLQSISSSGSALRGLSIGSEPATGMSDYVLVLELKGAQCWTAVLFSLLEDSPESPTEGRLAECLFFLLCNRHTCRFV